MRSARSIVVVVGNGYLGIASKKSRVRLSLGRWVYQGASNSSWISSDISDEWFNRRRARISRFPHQAVVFVEEPTQKNERMRPRASPAFFPHADGGGGKREAASLRPLGGLSLRKGILTAPGD